MSILAQVVWAFDVLKLFAVPSCGLFSISGTCWESFFVRQDFGYLVCFERELKGIDHGVPSISHVNGVYDIEANNLSELIFIGEVEALEVRVIFSKEGGSVSGFF